MLLPKDFLLQECENVERLLSDTLRFAYSSKSSFDVYSECLSRLRIIRGRAQVTRPGKTKQLHELWVQLSALATLVGRVERSHIEEFSWPFADALQRLAVQICGTGSGASRPLFFISADDELSSYSIITEAREPGLQVRPLYNIIFPRSLKHFVLLHPILGHEVAHAACAVPHLSATLLTNVIEPLIKGSVLADRNKFKRWLINLGMNPEPDLIDYALMSWPEELYCDLFGLLLMGPSYIGAICSMLHSFDIESASDSHPPSLTRYHLLDVAVSQLSWITKSIGRQEVLRRPVRRLLKPPGRTGKVGTADFSIVRPRQVEKALRALQAILRELGNCTFQLPPPKILAAMVTRLQRARPPVASTVARDLSVSNDFVDFRSILFAGWLAWYSDSPKPKRLSFLNLNLLSDRGILQQSAVDHWVSRGREGTKP